MDIQFKISKEELIDFHMVHITETKLYKYQTIVSYVYNLMILLFIMFYFKKYLYTIAGLITLAIILLLRKGIFRRKLKRRFLKIYSFDKYANLFELTNLSIVEDGLKFTNSLSEKIYKWDSLKSIHLLENYVLIRTDDNEELLIPLISFNSSENKQNFLDTIIKNTNLELQKKYPNDVKYI